MKTEKYIFRILMVIIAILTAISAFAQDSHLSLHNFTEIMYNPATTGQTDYTRCATQFRTQWGALGTKITTTTIAADLPIKERVGIGAAMLSNDGSRIFSTFNVYLSGAYQIMDLKQTNHRLSVGLQMGIIQKSFNQRDFIFNNQYNNGYFDPDMPNYENLQNLSVLMPDFNYGLYYRYKDNAGKATLHSGFSIFHITTPSQSFFRSDDSRLPRRWSFHCGADYQTSERFTVSSNVLYQLQGNVDEFVFALNGKYLTTYPFLELIVGTTYRHNDAVIINVGADYRNLTFLMAYDITISKLKDYFKGLGGLEFGIAYRIGKTN